MTDEERARPGASPGDLEPDDAARDDNEPADEGATTDPAADRDPARTPRVVWWVVALHVVVLGAYSILLPTYRAPDEPLHVDLAHHWSTDFDYPAWDDRDTADGLINSLFRVRFPGRSAHLTAEESVPKDERPSYEDLDRSPSVGGVNQLPQHPPLYYIVAGTAERAVEVVTGDPDFHLETWFYRLVSIAMVAPLPFLIWKASRVIDLPVPVALTAMLIPLAIPQYLHIGASVNNDNLQFLAVWTVMPFVLRMARGDVGTRTMVLAGVVTGIGLLAKAFAFMIPVWVACALALLLLRRGRGAAGEIVRAGLVYSVPTMLIGGWWWVRNLVLYGALMPTRYFDMVQPVPRGDLDLFSYLGKWITGTVRRLWGDFGYFDTRIPAAAVGWATTISVIALIVAMVGRDRVAHTRFGDRLLLFVPLPLVMAMQLQTALGTYLENGHYAALQGRYWFGALAPIAILMALGAAKATRSFRSWLPFAVLACAAVMNGLALSAIFGFYWGSPGSALSDRVRAMVAWAPVPGEVIGVGALVGAIVAAATLVEIGRAIGRDRGGRAPGTPADHVAAAS